MRPYVPGEDMTGVSVSASDYMLLAGNPDPGGFIARNPKNHADKWYVAQAYFEENLEPADAHARDPAAELRARIQNIIHVLEKKPIHWLHSPDALVQTVDELRAALAATEGSE
jgi:hypothetical protein